MSYYVPIFSKIVDSSLWTEPDFVVKVFITMLAKKDRDNICRGNAFNIAQWSKKTEAEVIEALKILASPDTRRLEPQEFEGRRIEKVGEGWLLLNGETYQKLMKDANRRIYKTEKQREYRQPAITPETPSTATGTTKPEGESDEPPAGTDVKPDKYHPNARATLFILNEASGKNFRETDANLAVISARLRENGVTPAGVKEMILRQCRKWGGGEFADYLQPSTLFGPKKFDGYYASKDQPIVAPGAKPQAQRCV